MNFVQRVITIPEKLQSAVAVALVYLFVQAEVWLSTVTNIDFTGQLQPLGAFLAVFLAFLVKALLEKVVPERLHSLINTVLVWLAGFLAANALL